MGVPEPRVPEPRVPEPKAADSRTLQANERTLLAWIRTGMTLAAFGFVVARLGLWLRIEGQGDSFSARASTLVGVALIALGALTPVVASARYLRAHRALLDGKSFLPSPYPGVVLGATVAVGAAILAVLLLL